MTFLCSIGEDLRYRDTELYDNQTGWDQGRSYSVIGHSGTLKSHNLPNGLETCFYYYYYYLNILIFFSLPFFPLPDWAGLNHLFDTSGIGPPS